MHTNKSQISSQIFVYIIAVIILSITVLFGFKMVGYFKKTAEASGMNDFKIDFSNIVKEMSNEWGSLEKRKFIMNSKITHVCIGNSFEMDRDDNIITDQAGMDEIAGKVSVDNALIEELIKDSISNGVADNVFLIDKTKIVDSYFVENIKIWEKLKHEDSSDTYNLYFNCFENNNGVRLLFYATGKFVKITDNDD